MDAVEKKKKIQAIGTLTLNIMSVNDHMLEWLDAIDFNLPALAKGIGVDHEHKVRAIITIELVEEPCMICGKPITGDKICQNCGKPICDECAQTEQQERYCTICRILKQPDQSIMP